MTYIRTESPALEAMDYGVTVLERGSEYHRGKEKLRRFYYSDFNGQSYFTVDLECCAARHIMSKDRTLGIEQIVSAQHVTTEETWISRSIAVSEQIEV